MQWPVNHNTKMSRVHRFISQLNDYELAFFAKFKLLTFMKETQSEIKEYLAERNMSESKIEKLTFEDRRDKFKDNRIRCSRCQSTKIRMEKVEWTNTTDEFDISALDSLSGKATYKDKIICNVCGLWLTDPNNEKGKSIWNSIWNYISEVISRI
ncbi:hypothetical protein DCS32_11600 [Dokdonia sp. Dokd-P16]|nr:hypothetical protein DCS32_11600 [Dokdonia sp. Dokd-P16]